MYRIHERKKNDKKVYVVQKLVRVGLFIGWEDVSEQDVRWKAEEEKMRLEDD